MPISFAEIIKNIPNESMYSSKGGTPYLNISPNNTSVRDSFTREDYEYFRRDEQKAINIKDVIRDCNKAYDDVGLIRNVIDLMADFAVKGISIVHPNKSIERFYKKWFKKINGVERSERFLNLFYRTGNVFVKRSSFKPKESFIKQMKSIAKPDLKQDPSPEDVLPEGEIPIKYTFLNPSSIELASEELSSFLGKDHNIYAIKLPPTLVNKVKNPETELDKQLLSKIPEDIKKSIKEDGIVVLDPNKIVVYFYKKDDWKAWATPMLRPILKELQVLEKLKLADIAALDGAISSIRVWKLGDLKGQTPILPSETEIIKLAEILNNNIGGGVMDLVWGPALELVETSTEVHKFLGSEKYISTLNDIYAGLGIPPTLTGSSVEPGFTNNFISLKTLIERLNYGREMLKDFWEKECKIVQKSMKFKRAAKIKFDDLLTDEAAQKRLLIDMWDRNIITDETFREMMGFDHEIEEARSRKQEKSRKNPKASPFHNPQAELNIVRQFISTNLYAPSEFGIELQPRKEGELTPIEILDKQGRDVGDDSKPKGQPGQGRPPGVKDKNKRKKKEVRPRTSAFIQIFGYAEDTQNKIASVINDAYIGNLGKKNLRELTDLETKELEDIKFRLLNSFKFGEVVNKASIMDKLNSHPESFSAQKTVLQKSISEFINKHDKEPTIDIVRRFNSIIYAIFQEKNETNISDDGFPQVS